MRRLILASFLLVLTGLWVGLLWVREGELGRWREVRRGGSEAIAAHEGAAPTAAARVERAVVLSEGMFPPRRGEALADLEAALGAAPLRSQTWFHVARNRLFAGEGGAARAAMARADSLDPWYPGQRLRAVQFWVLAGEPDRAGAVARSLAALGPRHQRAIARELPSMGFSPREAWQLALTETTGPAEGGRILLALEIDDAAVLEALAGGLPPHWYDDEEFPRLLFRKASNPFSAATLRRAWEAGHGPLSGSANLPLENPNLDSPPFRPGIAAGWLPPPAGARYLAAWSGLPAAGAPQGTGVLRLELPPAEGGAGWRLLRTVTAGVGEGERLVLRIRREGARPARAWLTVRLAGESVRSQAVDLDDVWQDLSIAPPAGRAGFVDLVLDIRSPAGRKPAVVLVERARVEGGADDHR